MAEEEVVVTNVRGEISDDQNNHIKGENCNGVAHENGNEKENDVAVVNGDVGGEIDGEFSGEFVSGKDAVDAGGNSGASDLVVVEKNNGAVGESEEHKVKVDGEALDESHVSVVSEAECEEVNNSNEPSSAYEKSEIRNGAVSLDVDVGGENGQNGEGSVVVLDVDKKDATVVEEGVNEIQDRELESVVQNGAEKEKENDIGDDVDGVNGTQGKGIQNGVADRELGEGECVVENEKEVVTVVEEVADLNDSHHEEVDCVAVLNDVMDKELSECAEEREIAVAVDGIPATDVEECADEDGQNSSAEKVQAQIDSVDSGGGDEKDGGTVVEGTSESVSDAVSDEKDVVTVVQEVTENGLADAELTESAEKKEIPVDVDVDVDGVSSTTDMKECVGEDAQISSEVEKAQDESVSDADVDKSVVVGEDFQKGLAEQELSECTQKNEISVEGEQSSQMERCEEESGHELVRDGEDLSALNSTDVAGDGNVVSNMNDSYVESQGEQSAVDVPDMKNNAVESEAVPSNNAVESEAEPSNNAVEGEAEPSNSAVEIEAEPSNNAVESEAEPSNNAVESEAEPSNNAVEIEAEPSNNAAEGEAEPSNNAVEIEAEPSNNAAEGEAEPSNNPVESEAKPSNNAPESEAAEPSVERELPVEGEGGDLGDVETRPAQEGSITDALDGQNMGSEVVKRPFYYLIRLPRYDDDENIKEQINSALRQVEEKTKIRDAIRAESQTNKANCKECGQVVRAAVSAERAARELLKSKRQEMDSVQSTMSRLNNAISVGDIDGKIRNMEHMIEHETLPLKEEKQLIRQIKQLKQNREELSSNMGKQDQSQQSLDQKDSIEEHSKQLQLLKKEVELLRNNVLKAEAETKAARKKYDDECNKLSELHTRFKAADDVRQEAYVKYHTLKRQLHEKSKYFWEYKNDARKGQELAAEGKREELQCFCVDQVERIMELWNKNGEFRRDYVRCNTRSTLRRLQTLDGRSLGPDEKPPVIPNPISERASKNNSLTLQSTAEQEKKSASTESVSTKDEPVSKVVEQRTERSQTTKAKKPAKPAPLEKPVVASRWGDEPDEDKIEEPVRTKEEEELILKAEKARKEEEAAKLKEKRRQEEIEKAKEAMERKRRNAEKAQQRAAIKAQKEAEQKEKEREKRAKKKERRKAASSTDTVVNSTEQESAPSSETLTRSTEECDQSEKPVEVTKKPLKPSQFTRQTKAKSVPLPLRNRGKRRIQPWMWVLIAVLVVIALFYMGNNSFLRSRLLGSDN